MEEPYPGERRSCDGIITTRSGLWSLDDGLVVGDDGEDLTGESERDQVDFVGTWRGVLLVKQEEFLGRDQFHHVRDGGQEIKLSEIRKAVRGLASLEA